MMICIDSREHQNKLRPSGEVYQLFLLLKNRTVILQRKEMQVIMYILFQYRMIDIKRKKIYSKYQ